MATIGTTTCDVGGAIPRTNQASIYSRPPEWIPIEHPDLDSRFHHLRSRTGLELPAMLHHRIVAPAAASAPTPRRRTSRP
jgi:hypothetical protein